MEKEPTSGRPPLLHPLRRALHSSHTTVAVLAAAGSSRRMQGGNKLFLPLCGKPVLAHTLLAFEKSRLISGILLVGKEEDFPAIRELLSTYGIEKSLLLVPGGKTRQESVRNALDAIGEYRLESKISYVAIADGDRPLTTPDMIDRVVQTAFTFGAASAGCPATDTVKLTDASGYIEQTPDRSNTWLAQTPQVFRLAAYQAAAYTAEAEGYAATDDNALLERIGIPVRMVDCGPHNLKITRPGDLEIAQTLLALKGGH
ncbi:MAG: 2-C-methyl-D-erythritol 4-phosphate cytidylyltransferase [Clostridia bacterium]|nr:2-C-methyl-D-erythritol 4-phosphate cytidylyltransferase [Clostridia bacterium]